MFKLLNRFREPLIVGALLVVPLVTYLTTGRRGREPNTFDRMVLAVTSPLQSALTWVIDGVGSAVSGYVALRGAHDEARALKAELAEAKEALTALNEAKAENERLKKVLGYVDETVDPEILARVIGVNPSSQFLSVRINRGSNDGVREGMPVVTPDGVVGQVIRAAGSSADVMLVSDVASRVGVTVQRSRVRGSAAGVGDGVKLSLNMVRREEDVQDGDTVVTAGSDGIFPRGLLVGTVRGVVKPPVGLFLNGQVVPAVDFARLEEVLVIPVQLSVPGVLKEPGR